MQSCLRVGIEEVVVVVHTRFAGCRVLGSTFYHGGKVVVDVAAACIAEVVVAAEQIVVIAVVEGH